LVAKLTIEIPELVALRLEALASATGKSLDAVVLESLESTASFGKSRRAIVKARRAAAKAAGTTYSLADLGWLDGYVGHSVDEVLSFDGTDNAYSVLFTIVRAIRERMKLPGPNAPVGVERILLGVVTFAMEIDNGGYHQFFFNSSRQVAPILVSDLVRIGCPEIADITQRAIDALELPEVTADAIGAAIRTQNLQRDRILERCDIAFYERTELFERLLVYVKAHADAIRI
jgi:hypothetical protein